MRLHVTLKGGDCPRTLELKGRPAWMLVELVKAGSHGVTAIERPAPRISAYVHTLRGLGFIIDTEMEPHGGIYSGSHARYRLACDVSLTVLGGEGMA